MGAKYTAPLLPADFSGDPRVILAGASGTEWQSFSEDIQAKLVVAIVDAMSNVYIMIILSAGITALLSPFLGVSSIVPSYILISY